MKILLTLVLNVVAINFACAQFSTSFSVGLNNTRLALYGANKIVNNRESKLMTNNYSVNTEIIAQYARGKILLESGLGFSHRSASLKPDSQFNFSGEDGASLNLYFINFPMNIKYSLLNDYVRVGGGILNSFLFETDFNIASQQNKPYHFDIQGLVSVKAKPNIRLEYSYVYGGLNKIYDVDKHGTTTFIVQTHCFKLNYTFGIYNKKNN